MRKICLFAAISVAAALPVAAQNTDIESLSGLTFNFGNPGARSLGMGGAFLGLADDASASEANPAGLTVLRRPEVSLEVRNYQEQQLFTTSGTFPDLQRTAFSHKSQCEDIRKQKNDFFACLEYTILPFLSALTVQERTFGVAGAYKIGKVSVGGTVRYHRFNEAAFTFRVTPTFDFSSISVQATSDVTDQTSKAKDKTDWTVAAGVKWEPSDKS